MWIVTVSARHLAFGHGHVRALREFGALLLVTGVARFVDRRLLQQTRWGNLGHRVVAVAAGELVGGVD